MSECYVKVKRAQFIQMNTCYEKIYRQVIYR